LADLASLPVMTKAEMMPAVDEVVTDGRLTRQRVEAHLSATGADPMRLDDRYPVILVVPLAIEIANRAFRPRPRRAARGADVRLTRAQRRAMQGRPEHTDDHEDLESPVLTHVAIQ
jgi:hypothetical protein